MFSGIIGKKFPQYMVHRSIGGAGAERFGTGFICKAGLTQDYDHRAEQNYVVVLLLHGRGAYIDAEERRFELSEGMFFQRFPGMPHSTLIDPASDWQEFFLELGSSVFPMFEHCGAASRTRPVGPARISNELCERLLNLGRRLRELPDRSLTLLLPEFIALALEILTGGESGHREKSTMDELGCAYLSEDFSRPCDLRRFCRRHGWSYEKFRKDFKSQLGISPHRYRIRRRLDEACTLLRQRELNIGEIAEQLGYSSESEFSAQFKRHNGISPKLYRTGAAPLVRMTLKEGEA